MAGGLLTWTNRIQIVQLAPMQLTRAADYGVRVMICLAGLPQGSRANHAELVQQADVPPSFLSKVLQRLATARLIHSHRGSRGGFELAAPANTISLLDVVEAMEGPLCLNRCLMHGEGCDRKGFCAAHWVWVEAQERMAEVLRAAKLDALARDTAAGQSSQLPFVSGGC